MITKLTAILCGLAITTGPLNAGLWDNLSSYFSSKLTEDPQMIKVLIAHDLPGVILEVKGQYKIYDPHTKKFISTRFNGKRKFAQAVKDGIKWGEEFPGIHQILILPDNPKTTILVDGIEYKGSIYVYDIGGSISVVNALGYDDYINSILSSTFGSQPSPELLAALTIAARTNLLYQSENASSPYWSIEGKGAGYLGHAMTTPGTELEKTLVATHNMVLSLHPSEIQPFPIQWGPLWTTSKTPSIGQLTMDEAEAMAKNGANAARILKKAFPNSTIKVIKP